METVIKTASLLILMLVFPLFIFSCENETNEEEYKYKDTANEVRIPRVEEVNGKAVITWVDPYIADTKEIKVKDLQTNAEVTVEKGVQKAEFTITDAALLSYRYELKVVRTSGEITNGVIIRLVKNWAQKLHPLLDYNSAATPQSGMFFRNQPVATVKVFDIRNDENISKLTSAVIQGVVNQEQAQSYLLWLDQHLDELDDAGCSYEIQPLAATSKNSGFAALYNAYKNQFNCLIIWDENQAWSWSLALMISAQEKGIPVTAYMKNFIDSELGGTGSLQIKDIRSMWNSKAEAYDWAIENLADNCHEKISFSAGLRGDYKDGPWRMYDYTVACKGFCFWLDEANGDDKAIMNKIFDKMQYPVGSSVFGFGMNTIGDDLNKFTNTRNAGFVVSDYYANGSYWCSFPGKAFQQRSGIAGTVAPNKIYVAISLSDGDNVQFDQNSLYQIFKEGKRRGEVPVGVTLAAGLQDLNPKLLEFYYKNMTQNDEFTAGPSGFQFIYGDEFAQSGKYAEWIAMNKKWLSTAGFHTAHLWNTTEQVYFGQYMEGSGVDLVMDGSDRTHTTGASYKYVNKVVRIDQGTHCWGEGDVYRELMSVSPSPRRPLFKHIYLLTNYYGFDGNEVVVYERLIRELQRVEEDSPNTFEYMLPMDLAATIKKYIEEGGIY
jgi:hypothetical protein